MSITFTCPACSRRFTLDDRLAGKRGKCKSCGEEIRVPDLEGPPDLYDAGADDPYGLDDLPSTSTAAPPTGAARNKEALAVGSIPSRGRERKASGKKTSKRTKSGAGPWGVELRRTACACLFFGLFASRALRAVPLEFRSNPFVSLITFATLALMGLGSLLTVVAVVGASVSLISGNFRAFASDTSADMWGWFSVLLFTPIFIGFAGYRMTHPLAGGPGPRPPGGMPGWPMPAGAAAPAAALGSEVRSDIHVTLANGRFMRNSSPFGTARPGVEISIDYQIDRGELAGIEQLVLVIRSAKGRGELDNLHQMRFQRSGTIHASSFMARPEDGPYEAWVEVSSLPGASGQRKQVSSSVALQFTDMPTADPGASARSAAEAQRRQMMNPGPAPGMGPGIPPPGRMGPMGPGRIGPGPMGPRGGRFQGGPR
jgi:hypothetical protein